MPKQLILNSSNYQATNGTFNYKFPVRQQFRQNDRVGLSSISIYNSFYNVSQAYNNNTFQFIFPGLSTITDATMTQTGNTSYQRTIGLATIYTITIDDGYYSISDLNYYFQQQCILNGLYTITASGNYTYYLEIVTNSKRYAGQLNFYILPLSTSADLPAIPSNGLWSFPTTADTAITTQIIIPSGFGSLIGFLPGVYPPNTAYSNTQINNIQYISNTTPMLSVVNSLIMTCNLINNHGISIPSNIFDSIPLTNGFGSLITISASSIIYSDIANNDYENIQISFYDQNMNLLKLLDPDVLITLSIDKQSIQ